MRTQLTPDLLLMAYSRGIFPMAEGRDSDDIFWVDPEQRGMFPLDGFHISRSLKKRLLSGQYRVTVNTVFDDVILGCAARDETWINDEIRILYNDLHATGHAHSVEVWDGAALVGGVYGVALGAAYFGESMFSARRDASKIALCYLVARLIYGGFQVFDTQFITSHLASLGAIEVPRDHFQAILAQALRKNGDFMAQSPDVSPSEVLELVMQRKTQTS